MNRRRLPPRSCIRWVVYSNSTPFTVGYTRQQAVIDAQYQHFNRLTWAQLQELGYTVRKSRITPLNLLTKPKGH